MKNTTQKKKEYTIKCFYYAVETIIELYHKDKRIGKIRTTSDFIDVKDLAISLIESKGIDIKNVLIETEFMY